MKKINTILLLTISYLLPTYTQAAHRVTWCFNKPFDIKCVDQKNGNFSLDGTLYFKGKKYNFGARRAYGKDWCFPALEKIIVIMSAKEFCLEAEVVEEMEDYLTVENFSSERGRWSYFIDEQ